MTLKNKPNELPEPTEAQRQANRVQMLLRGMTEAREIIRTSQHARDLRAAQRAIFTMKFAAEGLPPLTMDEHYQLTLFDPYTGDSTCFVAMQGSELYLSDADKKTILDGLDRYALWLAAGMPPGAATQMVYVHVCRHAAKTPPAQSADPSAPGTETLTVDEAAQIRGVAPANIVRPAKAGKFTYFGPADSKMAIDKLTFLAWHAANPPKPGKTVDSGDGPPPPKTQHFDKPRVAREWKCSRCGCECSEFGITKPRCREHGDTMQ